MSLDPETVRKTVAKMKTIADQAAETAKAFAYAAAELEKQLQDQPTKEK